MVEEDARYEDLGKLANSIKVVCPGIEKLFSLSALIDDFGKILQVFMLFPKQDIVETDIIRTCLEGQFLYSTNTHDKVCLLLSCVGWTAPSAMFHKLFYSEKSQRFMEKSGGPYWKFVDEKSLDAFVGAGIAVLHSSAYCRMQAAEQAMFNFVRGASDKKSVQDLVSSVIPQFITWYDANSVRTSSRGNNLSM